MKSGHSLKNHQNSQQETLTH